MTGRAEGRPTVLVLRALGLGDLLTAVPALRAIDEAWPEHRIVLATQPWLRPLVRLIGAADTMIDAAPLQPLRGIQRPHVAINLHGRGPQSHRVALRAEPRRLIAFRHAAIEESGDSPLWDPDEHEVYRWCRLLVASGVPADPSRLDLKAPSVRRVGSVSVVHPGASSGARMWPLDRWAMVIADEHANGRRVVITGNADERRPCEHLASVSGVAVRDVLAGKTNLIGMCHLVAQAGIVMSGDTGVAHLATALGTPSVVLFGPTSPARWGPPPDRPEHIALWGGREGDPHAQRPDPSLVRIMPEDVIGAAALVRARSWAPTPLGVAS